MRDLCLPAVYPITDTRISGLSHLQQTQRLVTAGAQIIQLRDKHATPRDLYAAAAEALELARKHNVTLIINDRVDIAFALNADGVHLGQDDLPPAQARELLGESAVIGFSTHSVEQAIGAAEMPVDYIAIGPIFGTDTKENPDPVVGLEGIRRVRAAIGQRPLVAIGGIDETNIRSVLEAGADSAAVISAVFSDSADIEARYRRLKDLAG